MLVRHIVTFLSLYILHTLTTVMPTLHRGEIESWDLQSLLLKPIQRVLKYPLLLNKLVETTSDNHPDYKVVHSAQEAIAKVAQDINEIKRRKDLGK